VIVKPYQRLGADDIARIHAASMEILRDPGVWCYNERAAKLFKEHGAQVREEKECDSAVWRVFPPAGLVEEMAARAPSQIVLGARNPANKLLLDAATPRVYFGTGSEANVVLDTRLEEYVSTENPVKKIMAPVHTEQRGSTALLARAAHLCDRLDNVDFFIRPVNIQDPGVTAENHDANKFFASLNNITKHVQAGLTMLEKFDDVIRMAELVAGGKEKLKSNPVISFIACLFKSPLQIVDDTAEKVFRICGAGMPLVMSSSPQGGSSAPIQEAGMVVQINAEILAGVTLAQLINPGTPVLYGSVPVRARLDTLHDLYGCPEFNQYNADCVQMARHYGIPCYSSAGVGDAKAPGMQSIFEKMMTHLYVALTGPQYIHYAFGLLERTNTFSPLQAVLDDEQVGLVKHTLRAAQTSDADIEESLKIVRKVMTSKSRLFTRHTRRARHAGTVSEPYAFGTDQPEDKVIEKALERMHALMAEPAEHLPADTVDRIFAEVPGILPELKTV
jgi:trimethylamine--corrinoid protein Co-methyltransferase